LRAVEPLGPVLEERGTAFRADEAWQPHRSGLPKHDEEVIPPAAKERPPATSIFDTL
jgi:hypothetical protein